MWPVTVNNLLCLVRLCGRSRRHQVAARRPHTRYLTDKTGGVSAEPEGAVRACSTLRTKRERGKLASHWLCYEGRLATVRRHLEDLPKEGAWAMAALWT